MGGERHLAARGRLGGANTGASAALGQGARALRGPCGSCGFYTAADAGDRECSGAPERPQEVCKPLAVPSVDVVSQSELSWIVAGNLYGPVMAHNMPTVSLSLLIMLDLWLLAAVASQSMLL